MKTKYYIVLLFSWLSLSLQAQDDQGNRGKIRGYIRTQGAELELQGASIEVLNISPARRVESDDKGYFSIPNLPIGRYRLLVNKSGYEQTIVPDVLVNANETYPLIIILNAVQVEKETEPAERNNAELRPRQVIKTTKDQPYNPLSDLAARPFTIEEVFRYAGSRFDPALLVNSFAGISSYDDARNDIVVRGNSPYFLQWQLEELPLENPNHVNVLGRSGGTTPVLSLFALGQADFVKAHFGAAYGSASSGVFDLRFREGNKQKFSFLGQLGLQQTQLVLEGPMGNVGSFLVTGRVSTGHYLFQNLLPTDPASEDLNFKLHFDRQKWGQLELFGFAARSRIFIPYDAGTQLDKIRYLIFENQDYSHQNWQTLFGVKYTKNIGLNSFFRAVLGHHLHTIDVFWDNVLPSSQQRVRSYTMADYQQRYLTHLYYQNVQNPRLLWRVGLVSKLNQLNLREFSSFFSTKEVDFKGFRWSGHAYVQGRWQLRPNLSAQFGANLLHNTYNGEWSPQAKASLAWEFLPQHTLALGYALNHQMPTVENFFFNPVVGYDSLGDPVYNYQGRPLKNMRVQHLDLEYRWRLASDWRLLFQAYAQHWDRAIVDANTSSLFAMLNSETMFYPFYYYQLNNNGKARNYGVELTLEKFFAKGFYGLFSATLFDSRFLAPNGQWYASTFNNRYIVNILAGKEFNFGLYKQHAFFADLRFSTKGGRPYRPIDAQATYDQGLQNGFLEPVYDDSRAYQVRTPAFYQLDLKMGARLNALRSKTQHTIRLELFNVLNTKNIFTYQYSAVFNPFGQEERGEVIPIYQRGFIPDLTYIFQF